MGLDPSLGIPLLAPLRGVGALCLHENGERRHRQADPPPGFRLLTDAPGRSRYMAHGVKMKPIARLWGPGGPGLAAILRVDLRAGPVDSPVDLPAVPLDSPVDPVDVRRASRGRCRRRKTCKPQRLPK